MGKRVVFNVPFGDVELTVVAYYTPPQRGRYFGPPEDCCPEMDAEVEWEQVLIDGKDVTSPFLEMYALSSNKKMVDWLDQHIEQHALPDFI